MVPKDDTEKITKIELTTPDKDDKTKKTKVTLEKKGDDWDVTRSLHEALHNLADAIVNRRQLVLPLIKKTA